MSNRWIITERSRNPKRGTMMITIVHDGISETRHCRGPNGQGYLLDKDKARLMMEAVAILLTNSRLSRFGLATENYKPALFFDYLTADVVSRYRAHVRAELERARHISQRQQDALMVVALREQDARQLMTAQMDVGGAA